MLARWRGILLRHGFAGMSVRLDALAAFIVANGFATAAQMDGADHPKDWPGASDMSDAELDFVQSLVASQSGGSDSRRRSKTPARRKTAARCGAALYSASHTLVIASGASSHCRSQRSSRSLMQWLLLLALPARPRRAAHARRCSNCRYPAQSACASSLQRVCLPGHPSHRARQGALDDDGEE